MPRLTYANVMSTIAVFIALGGSGYAASKINGKKIKRGTIPANALRRNSLTGTQINEAKLGKVRFAGKADTAAIAASAADASKLGGLDPGNFQQRARYVAVDADGTIAEQSGGITVSRITGGEYLVDFGSSLTGKAIQVSELSTPASNSNRGNIAFGRCGASGYGIDCSPVASNDHSVIVATTATTNTTLQDHPFMVTVL